MKVLFVCWANVGRSQMAEAFYNHLTNSQNADSAGTEVEDPGETLGERKKRRGGTFVIEAMAEEGIDITSHKKTQLTEEMLSKYDTIVCMAQPEYTPVWLSDSPKFIRWDVEDPGGKGLEETIIARDAVKAKVIDFIKQTT